MISSATTNKVGKVILKMIRPGDEFKSRTYASPKQIQETLKGLDPGKYNNYYPYTYDEKLVLPGVNKENVRLPKGAQFLPVSTKALNTMTKHLIKKYPKDAAKELSFLTHGLTHPDFVQVTLLGTGLGLYYNSTTGEPMGK